MPRLFSYCIPVDDGAAPNPFWGYCTLAICKPAIRRVAQVGDWVIGTGSRRSPIGDLTGHLVYAMRVTSKLSMPEYDHWARKNCPGKIAQWRSRDIRRRLGDSIFDFSFDPPRVRESVHSEHSRRRDLSGLNVLISTEFYYLGDHPIALPPRLRRLSQQTRGHRSNSNDALLKPFLRWLDRLALKPRKLYGRPQLQLFETTCS